MGPKENSVVIFKSLTTNPNFKDKVLVGYVQKAHSLKGELLVCFISGENLETLPDEIYLGPAISNKEGPEYFTSRTKLESFEVLEYNTTPKGGILKVSNCDTRERAETLIKKSLYIDQDFLHSKKGESIFLFEVRGFDLYSREKNSDKYVGIIDNFLSQKYQDLLIIKDVSENQIEIPFVKDYIFSIDYSNKKIVLTLPKGILSINKN